MDVEIDFTGATVVGLSAGSGDVVGPASAADRNIPTFDGTTGKLIEDSGVGMDDVVTAISQAANAISRGKIVALTIGNSFL